MAYVAEHNHYEILDVSPEATLPELERAYRIARTTWQPGSVATYSVFSDQDSSEILRRVEEAYAVLSDARMRREYDARLRREQYTEPKASLVGAAPVESRRVEAAQGQLELTPVDDEAVVHARVAPPPRPLLELEPALDEGLEPPDGVFDGPVLRRIRMSRGIELEEISGVTKINELNLELLEANRYHDLPAPVYVRGFLKEYAKCLRLDPLQVANTYMARYRDQAVPSGRRA